MLKKILILAAVIATIVIAVIFIYRRAIIQYSVEKIVRSNLPPYIKFDEIDFNLTDNKVVLTNLRILNPPNFSSEYLVNIGSITFRYKVKGIGIPKGLEISGIVVKRPYIFIERLKDGRINLVEMQKFVTSLSSNSPQSPAAAAPATQTLNKLAGNKKLSDIIKLPSSFSISGGKIEFWDRLPYDKAHLITVEPVNGVLSMSFDDNYSKLLALAFTLEGNLNYTEGETIKWTASLNPTTPKLTMSNRFEVMSLDILSFEPYYDKHSPFIFGRGKFSGTLIFDFDNGNIGSTNEIRLSDILFWVKEGYENAQMWETNVQDMVRYFTTASGDIVFDFKIKGDMANPTFYLGPISKRAMTSMAIDKISSYAVQAVTKQADGATQGIDQTKDYINLIKGFINKK